MLRKDKLFFFSSRRRHTRWTGDWSSDVCSSDLRRYRRAGRRVGDQRADRLSRIGRERRDVDERGDLGMGAGLSDDDSAVGMRSEERRVGKEGRLWMTREEGTEKRHRSSSARYYL